jgi:hypothetical protein
MQTAIERRQVAWDPTTATLTVGNRRTVVTCAPGDNECILRTYLALVAEQRDIRLERSIALRRDDVVVLAELLDLDDAELEARLRRLLCLSETEAADLTRRLRRQRVVAAAVGVGLLAGVPASQAVVAASEAADATAPADPVVVDDSTVLSPDALDRPVVVSFGADDPPAPEPQPAAAEAAPATEPEPAPAPEPEPEVEVGYTVRYERDPDYVPPEGVEIGDAMVIERDPSN